MTAAHQESSASEQSVAKYLSLAKRDDFLFCSEPKATFLLDMHSMRRYPVEKMERISRWDFLSALKPPAELSLEAGKIWSRVRLQPGTPDFDFVAAKFTSTFNGKQGRRGFAPGANSFMNPVLPNFGLINNFGAGGGFNMMGAPLAVGTGQIVKIEKIHNVVLYEKFMNEFQRMLRKYPHMLIEDMMKHLFHGTRATGPEQIYSTEDGLDIRFSNSGMFGQGIYFADTSQYSHSYHHPTGKGEMQMFLALVLVGDSVTQPPGQYRLPPNKPGSHTERYDSINNGPGGGHYIIYDNVKSYPAYLITYK